MSNPDRFPLKDTAEVPERALLVGVEWPGSTWPLEETLAELERLAATAGAQVVATTTQKMSSVNPKTFVGSGKADEIAQLCRIHNIDVVIFDDELSPSQQSNLERIVGKDVKVIDRTALILDIFALHATTREGRLQVRLAQNQYLYPRLRGMWAHLASNRMGGGVGSRFGEGESQLEVDRRMVRNRMTAIKRELADLERTRNIQRHTRLQVPSVRVALAGYTNAGKSSLLNTLTGSDVLSYDKLFATLDSTTRKLSLPEGRQITLTDTVGFIQKLPTTLVEAFKSTLDEIREASIIVHVIDASSNNRQSQIDAVENVLEQIGAQDISRIEVFNKVDLLNPDQSEALQARYPSALLVSAHTGYGLDDLLARIALVASAQDSLMSILLPYDKGNLRSLAHDSCMILNEEHTENGTRLEMRVPPSLISRFEPYSLEQEH